MDRIGAIKDYMRSQNRRDSSFAPVPFWRRVRLSIIVFCLICFLSGFVVGQAHADTIPADRVVTYSQSYCSVPFSYLGAESGLSSAFSAFWNSPVCSSGNQNGAIILSSFINVSTRTLTWSWSNNPTSYGSAVYTLTGTYSCPSGYTLSGTNCVSVPVCPTGYVLDSTGTICVAVPSGTALTAQQAAVLDWLAANQTALVNVLNNQSTLAAAAFDPVTAGQFFAWGFCGIMLIGIAAMGAGSVLGFIDKILKY